MINKPTVSIICTNFNKGEWIRNALDSFLDQKANFGIEIIIIDDASTDGSPKIIKEYVDKYPDRIRALYNKKNLGITKTWIEVCKHAEGKYIARCDGDDFWIDPKKLQKQVGALDASVESKWSSTDFNIISPKGKVTELSAFEKGIIERAYSYEGLLATKGFTMPSTWLVETQLMLSVNDDINIRTVDDTFDIQLELFHRTKLTYLPYATVAYRIGHESDSHPFDIQKIKHRNDRLLSTQLEYIDKYNDVNFIEMVKFAIRANTNTEEALANTKNELSKKYQIVEQQQAYIRDQERLIRDQRKLIKDQDVAINDIVNSRRYRLAALLARPISLIKQVKDKVKL